MLSAAVAKEIGKNIRGLVSYSKLSKYAEKVLAANAFKGIEKSRYVNDSKITDHYAIIPTGQGISALDSVSATAKKVYETIARRFLSIFYPPAVYRRINITVQIEQESFFSSFRMLEQVGYFEVAGVPSKDRLNSINRQDKQTDTEENDEPQNDIKDQFIEAIMRLKAGMKLSVNGLTVKEGETSAPKGAYSSGTLILAMENAGQLIEDEELRAQIKAAVSEPVPPGRRY